MAEKKEDQINSPMSPSDAALFRAIAREEGYYSGQLARKILLDWVNEWMSRNPDPAQRIRDQLGIESPPKRPKSGGYKRAER